jgi:hypothetical protein
MSEGLVLPAVAERQTFLETAALALLPLEEAVHLAAAVVLPLVLQGVMEFFPLVAVVMLLTGLQSLPLQE